MTAMRGHRQIVPLVLALTFGCSTVGDDTFWRFAVAGQQYELDRIELVVTGLSDGRSFLALGPAAFTATPGAAIQWRMPLRGPDELSGRELRFTDIMATESDVDVTFTLTDDLSAIPDVNSGLVLRFSEVDEDYVEGSFDGTAFVLVSMTDDQTRVTGVTGEFRAKLDVQ